MAEMEFNVDFHCHPTLRVLYTAELDQVGKEDYWVKTVNPDVDTPIGRWTQIQTKDIGKESQTNFLAMMNGGTRIVVDSLYPPEKGWFNFRKFPKFVAGKRVIQDVMQVATGINSIRLAEVQESQSYFEELIRTYEYLCSKSNKTHDNNYFSLPSSWQELEHNLADPNCLNVLLSLEGAHALGTGSAATQNLSLKQHKKLLSKNIRQIKSWKHPVLYISLSHHFWNQLAGQARSFKNPFNLVFNQGRGLDSGITELGWHVIKELLSDHNGPRIPIDVKHMSLAARSEYYAFVQQNNYINSRNPIPIICSHTGVNGYKTMLNSGKLPDSGSKMRGTYFHNWSINLSAEEIKYIHDSKGVMGIMLDKGLLAGSDTIHRLDSIKNPTRRRNAYVKLILDNIFFAVEAIQKQSAWDIPVLGSDFDGLISHIEFYPNVGYHNQVKQDLIDYLNNNQYKTELWFGYTPEMLMKKVFQLNSLNFIRRQFEQIEKGRGSNG